MKHLSRLNIILMLVILIFLGVGILFVIGYFQAVGETPDLEKQIKQTQSQINALPDCDPNEKYLRIEELINQLATISPFPAVEPDNTEFMDAVIALVDDARVYIDKLEYKGTSSYGIESTSYRSSNYALECVTEEGREERFIVLLELFEELREEEYGTLMVESVKLPGGSPKISFDIKIITQ